MLTTTTHPHHHLQLLLGATFLALTTAACGGSSDGTGTGGTGGTQAPVDHAIASNDLKSIPAGNALEYGPIGPLPASSSVGYAITDQTQTVTADHFNVAVLNDLDLAAFEQGGNVGAYGEMNNVTNASGRTPALPAGTYDLVIVCTNLVDNCILATTAVATY